MYFIYDFRSISSFTVEQEKLVEIKKAKEYRIEEKSGVRDNTKCSEMQANQEEQSPMRFVAFPMSLVSSSGDQVQAMPFSPSPPKEGQYSHYSIM